MNSLSPCRRTRASRQSSFGRTKQGFVLLAISSLAIFAGQAAISESAWADEPTVLPVWPEKPPGFIEDEQPEQDTSKPDSRLIAGRPIIRLGHVDTPELHVFLPPEEKATGAGVVICPGGGYSILAWDLEGTEVAEWLNSQGVAAFVLKYRVPSRDKNVRWLPSVQDAQRTLSLVRSKANDWKLDSDKLAILGFSAGGKTATMTSTLMDRQYTPVDEVDEHSCRPNAAILVYPAYLANDDQTALIDEVRVTDQTPPAFIVHAFDDPITVQGSLLLMAALRKAKVPSELHVFDTGGHGYGLRHQPDFPVTDWPRMCERWLKRNGWIATIHQPEREE